MEKKAYNNAEIRSKINAGFVFVRTKFEQAKIQLKHSLRYNSNKRSFLISGFHRALLESITFISRINALDYTKLRG